MRRRRRLVTPLAVGIVVLGVAALVGWGLARGYSMFSPGGLNAQAGQQVAGGQSAAGQPVNLGGVSTHAALGNDCGACHALPLSAATMADKCLGCHQDVKQEMTSRTGLHGGMLATGWTGTCGGCHTEHHGATGALTVLSDAFPHQLTGFSLRAHGGRVDCKECHVQSLTTFDPTVCADCHERRRQAFLVQHTAAFGSACVPCHDGVDRYGRDFDHNKLAFPLAAGHAGLSCDQCHKAAASVETLKQTPQDCNSCHAKDDAHAGKFGKDCGGCHTPKAWKDATFDHSKTSFPLQGAHAGVVCDKCHVGGKFTAISADCVSCHAEPAFHQGAFGSQSTQCAACHTTTAWTPATFAAAHDAFPLDHGSQEQTPTCKTCHPSTVSAYTCFGCHEHTPQNIVARHEGRPADQLQDCIACHAGGRGGD